MKVLFYFFKNVHIPLFLPIINELHTCYPEHTLYFTAPSYNPNIREGLSPQEKSSLNVFPGTWVSSPQEEICDIAIMADCVADRLSNQKKIINIGHGLISKGQYYCDSPLIGRENLADIMCVPGPWHKQELEKYVHIPIEVTGMSKLDTLFTPIDKNTFCRENSIDPNKPILLWAPTFNFELSSIPVLWTQIRQLISLGQVLIKTHGSTDIFFTNQLQSLASQYKDIHYIEDLDSTPYMKIADLMITDVSSVMFEFAALDKPLVLVNNPHMKEYKNYRPHDVEYAKRNIGPIIDSVEDLFSVIKAQLENPTMHQDKRKACTQEMFAATDGGNSKRIAEVIHKNALLTIPPYSYDIIIQSTMPIEMIQKIRTFFAPEIPLYVFSSTTIDTIPNTYTYSNNQELINLLSHKHSEYLLIYQRPAELIAPWEKTLFSPLNMKHNTPDIIGTLSTNPKAIQSNFQNKLKTQQYNPPAEMTIAQLHHFLRYTNPGEYLKTHHIDSPIYSIKKSTFLKSNAVWGSLATTDTLQKYFACDSLVIE